MACAYFFRRLSVGLTIACALIYSVPAALALSTGCAAVNALSGSSTLAFSTNRYPASDFTAGDALTLSFTDSGGAYGGDGSTADSVSIARYNLSSFQTYNAASATSSSAHTVTITVPTGSLEANGVALRATTSNGQISNLVFTCTSVATTSSDATLSGLSLSSGTLSPSFSAATSSYSASVANSVSSVTVKVVDRVIHVFLPHQIIGILTVDDVQIDKSNAFVTACQHRLKLFLPLCICLLAGDIADLANLVVAFLKRFFRPRQIVQLRRPAFNVNAEQVVTHFNKAVKKLIYQRFKAFKHLLIGEWGNTITF
nr:DUF4097 domain-containing protein [Erwinia mallotivora]